MISSMIEGIEFVIKDHKKKRAIVSLSLGGFKSAALNFAIQYASKFMGIHFATAAGNENKNACDFSPASAPNSITVGASRKNNKIAPFSNIGGCVDLYAPGVDINSTWPNGRYRSISGTSMATPHVAGVMAIYLGLVDFKPCDLKERILKDTKRIIRNKGSNGRNPMASLEKLYYRLKVE